jgi:hypothetical protein
VGKTSMARILAKALNCLEFAEPTPTPCCQCESCKAVAEGQDIDVVEIDAASNTGVDNIRELRSNSTLRPARSRFKIYIIDEVHMLSTGAFNALLKTLEEPPPRKVYSGDHGIAQGARYDTKSVPAVRFSSDRQHTDGLAPGSHREIGRHRGRRGGPEKSCPAGEWLHARCAIVAGQIVVI